MERHVIWSPLDEPGIEHLHLLIASDEILADSLLVAFHEGRPFRARYTIRCDGGWRVREVQVALLDSATPPLALRSDGAGNWATLDGAPLPALDGCIDIDISATPFTNTLPIRRLALPIGASRDLDMVYIRVPELRAEPDPQRYTRLDDRRYRYESRDSDFTADLPVDADGLVLDYPGLFRRVWPV
jgi:uncharacterized protein